MNIYGWGSFSPIATIKAATVPDQCDPVSTTANGLYANIAWTAPNANNDAITAYQILIRKADGTYAEDLTSCDGTQPTIITNLQCNEPFTSLRTTYGLGLG